MYKNVRDFGAKGDGKSMDTAAIQSVINQGGIIYFPPGTYLCGTLYLESNCKLIIDVGAVLLASPIPVDYNANDFIPQNKTFSHENVSGAHFIVAVEKTNITITGGGRIDGNRQAFYNEQHEKFSHIFKLGDWRPGQMLFFCECDNIKLENIELYNSPYWNCFLHGCEDVFIRGLKIWNDQRTLNGDGIDIDCCRKVLVSDCIIESSDDCITMRADDVRLKKKKACEFITINNCILHTRCNAFRIGVGNGIIRNCVVSNCNIKDTRTGICIISRYSKGSIGVEISNISFNNIMFETVRPIFIGSDVRGPQQETAKTISNISFQQLRGCGSRSSLIVGNVDSNINNISLNDINFDYHGGEDIEDFPEAVYGEFGTRAAPAAFYVKNANQVNFDKFKINWLTNNSKWTHCIKQVNCNESTKSLPRC
jgi:polygalacturonase